MLIIVSKLRTLYQQMFNLTDLTPEINIHYRYKLIDCSVSWKPFFFSLYILNPVGYPGVKYILEFK